MPMARGRFHKAVLFSGSATRVLTAEAALRQVDEISRSLHLETIDAIGQRPGADILEAQEQVVDHDFGVRNGLRGRVWAGVVDGHVLASHPALAVQQGSLRDVPVLTCCATEEAQLFEVLGNPGYAPADGQALLVEMRLGVGCMAEALLAHYSDSHPDASLARLRSVYLTDYIYRARVVRLATDQVNSGGKAWSLLFDFASPQLGRRPRGVQTGARHAPLPTLG